MSTSLTTVSCEWLEELEERLAQAKTLILAAPLFMPTWPENEGRNGWVRDANKWLNAE